VPGARWFFDTDEGSQGEGAPRETGARQTNYVITNEYSEPSEQTNDVINFLFLFVYELKLYSEH